MPCLRRDRGGAAALPRRRHGRHRGAGPLRGRHGGPGRRRVRGLARTGSRCRSARRAGTGVGAVRDVGFRAAFGHLRLPTEEVWVLNTDADSVVPPDWAVRHLHHADGRRGGGGRHRRPRRAGRRPPPRLRTGLRRRPARPRLRRQPRRARRRLPGRRRLPARRAGGGRGAVARAVRDRAARRVADVGAGARPAPGCTGGRPAAWPICCVPASVPEVSSAGAAGDPGRYDVVRSDHRDRRAGPAGRERHATWCSGCSRTGG